MTVLEKIEFLLKENHLNKRQFSIRSDMPYSTVDNIWKRGTESMRLPTFMKICDYFGVTMDSMAYDDREIAYRTDPAVMLARDEKLLMEDFAKLDERGKSAVLNTASREAAYLHEEKRDSSVKDA